MQWLNYCITKRTCYNKLNATLQLYMKVHKSSGNLRA